MKKLVCSSMAILLLAGVVFADPKLMLQARAMADFVTVDFTDDANNEGFKLGGHDTFGAILNDELYGVSVVMRGYLPPVAQDTNKFKFEEYFGWFKLGDVSKVSFGKFNSRFADRVNDDCGNFIIFGTSEQDFGVYDNAGVFTTVENVGRRPWENGVAVEYFAGGFTFLLGTGINDTQAYNVAEHFTAKVGYVMNDVFTFSANVIRIDSEFRIGAYVKPIIVDGFKLVAGYSGRIDTDDSARTIHGAELRARYAFDKASVTLFANGSFGNESYTVYGMLNGQYVFTDMISAALYAEDMLIQDNYNKVMVSPRLIITAAKQATVSVGPELSVTVPDAGDTVVKMSIPCVFRIKY